MTSTRKHNRIRHRSALAGLLGASMLMFSGLSNAALLNFSGFIENFDDVVITQFTIASDQQVRLWTDSFDSGANFDPITALWAADGSYIDENDDNDRIGPDQTWYDSGLVVDLTAGTYYFTIAVFNNFARSNRNLFSGPSPFDGQNRCPGNTCTGGDGLFYSQWLDGVESANVIGVSEPGTFALLALGLAGLGFARKRS